jgi:hypothetical protein
MTEKEIAKRFNPYLRKWQYVNLRTNQVYASMNSEMGLDYLWARIYPKVVQPRPHVKHVHIDCKQ